MLIKKKISNKEQQQNKAKLNPGLLRLRKDLDDYNQDKIKGVQLIFPNKDNIMNIQIKITITEKTYWTGAKYTFEMAIPNNYPIYSPKIKLRQKIFHPNIDFKGNICLPIIRDDWRPTFTLTTIILGLLFLFLNPNPKDPLNVEAAQIMCQNINLFKEYVNDSLRGKTVKGQKFQKLI